MFLAICAASAARPAMRNMIVAAISGAMARTATRLGSSVFSTSVSAENRNWWADAATNAAAARFDRSGIAVTNASCVRASVSSLRITSPSSVSKMSAVNICRRRIRIDFAILNWPTSML
jgi:hypothetical protein